MRGGRVILFVLNLTTHFVVNTDGCNFGPGCTFPCHCHPDELCHNETGQCPSRQCDQSPDVWHGKWTGPGCQIGNQALHKQTFTSPGSFSEHTVDGSTSQCINLTLPKNITQIMWFVDLEDVYYIYNISIWFSNDTDGDLIQSIELKSGKNNMSLNQSHHKNCSKLNEAMGHGRIKYVCRDGNVLARYVALQSKTTLYLCEVAVTGYLVKECDPGWWGPGCLWSCDCEIECDDVRNILCQTGGPKPNVGMNHSDFMIHPEHIVIIIAAGGGTLIILINLIGLVMMRRQNRPRPAENTHPIASISSTTHNQVEPQGAIFMAKKQRARKVFFKDIGPTSSTRNISEETLERTMDLGVEHFEGNQNLTLPREAKNSHTNYEQTSTYSDKFNEQNVHNILE